MLELHQQRSTCETISKEINTLIIKKKKFTSPCVLNLEKRIDNIYIYPKYEQSNKEIPTLMQEGTLLDSKRKHIPNEERKSKPVSQRDTYDET